VRVRFCRWHITLWPYEAAKDGERGGVLISLSPRGTVEIRENLIRKASRQTVQTLRDNPIAPKPKASYATPLRRMPACHKSMAVQEVLLSAPRVAKELAAVRSFVELNMHTCVGTLSREDDPQGAYRVLETQAAHFARKLDLAPEQGEDVWSVFPPSDPDDVAIYLSVKTFSDHELEGFRTLLTALSFGQEDCDRFDTKDSLFNVLAQNLNISMRNHWRPDRSFFEKRTRDQLVSVAKECGFADGGSCLGSYKKSVLVSGLAKFFADAQGESDPSEAQEKAGAWLPDVMLFPAVDPDKADASGETDAEDEEGDDESADADEAADDDALVDGRFHTSRANSALRTPFTRAAPPLPFRSLRDGSLRHSGVFRLTPSGYHTLAPLRRGLARRPQHRAAALRRTAATRINLVDIRRIVALAADLVVVTELLTGANTANRLDIHATILDHRFAIRIALMIDEARAVAADSGVDHGALVDDEQERVVVIHIVIVIAPIGLGM
jgi:hypothetical protein